MGTPEEHERTDPRAPGDLDLVRVFVNTYDVESDEDQIETADATHAWLVERDLIAPTDPIGAPDVERLQQLREALRELMQANHDGAVPNTDAVATLERIGAAAPLTVGFDDGKAVVRPATGGVDGFIGRVLTAIATAETAGTWERLKVCGASTCRWTYYDESKNRSRHWCSMAVCGNREKARKYRARQRST